MEKTMVKNKTKSTLVELIEFEGGDPTNIIRWEEAQKVRDEMHQILSRSKYGLNSPVANANIIKLLIKYKYEDESL